MTVEPHGMVLSGSHRFTQPLKASAVPASQSPVWGRSSKGQTKPQTIVLINEPGFPDPSTLTANCVTKRLDNRTGATLYIP